ncbi:MAG: MFS transporter [Pseudomonadota bacterium]
MSQTSRHAMAVLAPGLIAYSMGQTVLFALAGPAFREMGLRETQLGIIISAAAVVFVFSSAVWGRISDRWGRRPTIVFGLTTYGLISLAFAGVMHLGLNASLAVTTTFISLLLLRLLYAALGAGIQPASVALMADLSDEQGRSSAIAGVGAAFGIGMVLGPASAALLVSFGLLTPLYAIAVFGLITALVAWFYLPSVPRRADDSTEVTPLDRSTLIPLIAAGLAFYIAMSVVQQTFAFNLQDVLQLDSTEAARLTGFCFMTIAVGTLGVQGGVIQVLKPTPSTLLLVGFPLVLASLLIYATATSFIQLIASAAVMGCGFGLVTPGLLAAASLLSDEQQQGKVAGLMQATMSAGYVIGPVTGTAVYELQRLYAPGVAVVSAILAGLFVGVWYYQYRRANPAQTASP